MLIVLSLMLGCATSSTVYAKAKLIFSPQRVIMQGNNRTAALTLTNGGDEAAIFRISLTDVLYLNNGGVKHTDKPPAGFPTARPYLRVSPRQVRLAPGETQIIRILAKRPSVQNMEYRVHALLKQLSETEAIATTKGKGKAIAGRMQIMQASAIPIIYRVGKTQVTAAIAAAKKTSKGIDLVLTRSGSKSVYMTLEVYKGSQAIPSNRVSVVKGISIPVPNARRSISIAVDKLSNQQSYLVVMKDYYSNKVLTQSVVK